MNILLVTPFFTPQTGGVATFLEDVRRFLGQQGHEVYVLRAGEARTIQFCSLNTDGRVYELYLRQPWVDAAPVRSLLGFVAYLIPTLWRLNRFLREKQIQLVSLEYPLGFMFYFALLRRWSKFKLLVGLHGDDVLSLHLLPLIERIIVKGLIRRADWVMTHSDSLMRQAEKIVQGMPDRRSFLPYGIDCERLRQRANQVSAALPDVKGPYILTVAKLYDRKGIDVLLQAVQKVQASLNGTRFLFVGDGPEETKLKQLAVDLGVSQHVVFAGDVPNPRIPSLFNQAQFFVLPSRSEPFGIVLLEAMTFGKAILATRVGGIPEFVTDGINGLLVPAEDPDALAGKLLVLLQEAEQRAQIGKNGLAVVETIYDYRALVKKYEALYARILGQAVPSAVK